MSKKMTDEQKASRTRRRQEILVRINGSGEAAPKEAAKLAAEIETFEWAGGDAAEAASRRAVTTGMLGSGSVPMTEIVNQATAAIATLSDFSE
jgi:hypothetical protein